MKLFFTSILCLFSTCLYCQCNPSGNVTLLNQAQVNAWVSSNANCTNISGSLFIGPATGSSNITNLTGLHNLQSIQGELFIRNNPNLSSLNGLHNISSVSSLYFINVSQITSMNVFSNVYTRELVLRNTSITNVYLNNDNIDTLIFLDIKNNLHLTSISLNSIEYIENANIINNGVLTDIDFLQLNAVSSFTIENNAELTSFELENLTTVEDYMNINDNPSLIGLNLLSTTSIAYISISGNTNFTSLTLPSPCNLETIHFEANENILQLDINSDHPSFGARIGGNNLLQEINLTTLSSIWSCEILNNNSLNDIELPFQEVVSNLNISGNQNLSAIDLNTSFVGRMDILYNPILTSIEGLSNIQYIEHDLIVADNPMLSSLAMNSLETIGGRLQITGNSGLTYLGFSSLNEIGGLVQISGNSELSSISMGSLETVGGELLEIFANDNLTSINMSGLQTVIGELRISGNSNLPSLTMSSLNSIGEGLFISENPELSSINMSSLITIGGLLYIVENPELSSINMSSLNTIGGVFNIAVNPNLTSLSSFSGLTTIGGSLSISGNSNLTSLSGLENIDPVFISNLALLDCENLSECDLPNICTYIGDPYNQTSIFGNAPGCAIREEIGYLCFPDDVWYHDIDGDGFGNPLDTMHVPVQPINYVTDNTDCNDYDLNINPEVTEICNGIDDDCDGQIDENDQVLTLVVEQDPTGWDCDNGIININYDTGCVFSPAIIFTVHFAPGFELPTSLTDLNIMSQLLGFGVDKVIILVQGDNTYVDLAQEALEVLLEELEIDLNIEIINGIPSNNVIGTITNAKPGIYLGLSLDLDLNISGASALLPIEPPVSELFTVESHAATDDNCTNGSFDVSYSSNNCWDFMIIMLRNVTTGELKFDFLADDFGITQLDYIRALILARFAQQYEGTDEESFTNQLNESITESFNIITEATGGYTKLTATFNELEVGNYTIYGIENSPWWAIPTDAIISGSLDSIEACNNIDDDCDGLIDDDDPDVTDQTTWYADTDQDQFGDPESSTEACDQPEDFVENDDDCDDEDMDVNPEATEICNDNIDNNCDGEIDEGYEAPTLEICVTKPPSGWDCDDGELKIRYDTGCAFVPTMIFSVHAAPGFEMPTTFPTTFTGVVELLAEQLIGFGVDKVILIDDVNSILLPVYESVVEVALEANGYDFEFEIVNEIPADDTISVISNAKPGVYLCFSIDQYLNIALSPTILRLEPPVSDTLIIVNHPETGFGCKDGSLEISYESNNCWTFMVLFVKDLSTGETKFDFLAKDFGISTAEYVRDFILARFRQRYENSDSIYIFNLLNASITASFETIAEYVGGYTKLSATFSGLGAGTYEIFGIENSPWWTSPVDIVVTGPPAHLLLSATINSLVHCENGTDGSFYVNMDADYCIDTLNWIAYNQTNLGVIEASGQIVDPIPSSSFLIDGLRFGEYKVDVTDNYGQTFTIDNFLVDIVDFDCDGYTEDQGDFDDTNDQVNPGADEICNGIDDDCDNMIDEDGVCPLEGGLIGYWKFDNNFEDETPIGDGTGMNGINFTCDQGGNPNAALNPDGIDDYVLVPDDISLRPINLTITFWAEKTNTANSTEYFISKKTGIGTLNSFAVWLQDNVLYAAIADNTGYSNILQTNWAALSEGWHFISFTFINVTGGLRLYVDGDEVDVTTTVKSIHYDTHDILFGASNTNACGACHFLSRRIDNLRIYGRPLSESEVETIFTLEYQTPVVCAPDMDGDGYANNVDCNDTPVSGVSIHPDAAESCNDIDDDCDLSIDEGIPTYAFYQDLDGDTKGNPLVQVMACTQPPGYVSNNTDCDDTIVGDCPMPTGSATTNIMDVSATFIWTGNSCASRYRLEYRQKTSPAMPWIVVFVTATTYEVTGLLAGTNYQWRVGTVCTPGGTAVPAGFTNQLTFKTKYRVYPDGDLDGYGDLNSETVLVNNFPANGFSNDNTDCNDGIGSIYPNATELCNGVDDDCDMVIDDGIINPPIWYQDADGDGLGNELVTMSACTQPTSFVSNSKDCDDNSNIFVCTPPVDGIIESLTATTATISWSIVPCALRYTMQYRQILPTTAWTLKVNVEDPITTLTGLLPNKTYQFRVRSLCPSPNPTTSEWLTITFTTSSLPMGLTEDIESSDVNILAKANIQFDIYPNPGDGRFNISLVSQQEEQVNIMISDGFGKLIQNMSWNIFEGQNITQFDLSHISDGVYHVHLQSGDLMLTKKIVIVR